MANEHQTELSEKPARSLQIGRVAAGLAALLIVLSLMAFRPRPQVVMADSDWWNTAWAYRVPVAFDAAGYAREDRPAEVELDFTALLDGAGESGALDLDSLRVVEVDAQNHVMDESVPFQFDKAAGFQPSKKAKGTLIVLLEGKTAAGETRRYHVYFDLTGGSFTPADVPALVKLTDNATDEGFSSYRLQIQNGELYYHKTGGGFASFNDVQNHDWIGWNPAPGAAGDFRGVPNLVHPSDGGYFHPGRDNVNSAVIRRGPLRIMIRSTSLDGLWQTSWDIYPLYATMTVEKAPKPYWAQYEGTPGGDFEPDKDLIVRSTGQTNLAGESWVEDIPGPEWAYATDPAGTRALYFVHHEQDELVDSYRPLDNQMTILAFGRDGSNGRFLTQTPQQFTIGLVDSTDFNDVQAVVNNAYRPVNSTVGKLQQRPAQPTETPTVAPSKTPKPTRTPQPTATATIAPTATATVIPTDYRVYLSFTGRP